VREFEVEKGAEPGIGRPGEGDLQQGLEGAGVVRPTVVEIRVAEMLAGELDLGAEGQAVGDPEIRLRRFVDVKGDLRVNGSRPDRDQENDGEKRMVGHDPSGSRDQ
jgi:hypothetical protein